MGILNLKLRPTVLFDVTNRKHREDYAKFLATGSWGHCRVRYELDEPCGELSGAIQRKMLEYYTEREFKVIHEDRRVFKFKG